MGTKIGEFIRNEAYLSQYISEPYLQLIQPLPDPDHLYSVPEDADGRIDEKGIAAIALNGGQGNGFMLAFAHKNATYSLELTVVFEPAGGITV